MDQKSYSTEFVAGNETNSTMIVYCLKNNENEYEYSVFVSNFNGLSLPIDAYDLTLHVKNEKMKLRTAVMYRIDGDNTNPIMAWKNMSSPTYPNDAQLKQIDAASELTPLSVDYNVLDLTTVEFTLSVPAYGVVLLDLQYSVNSTFEMH